MDIWIITYERMEIHLCYHVAALHIPRQEMHTLIIGEDRAEPYVFF